MTRRSGFRRLAGGVFAALTLALAAGLIWAVLDIFLTGRALRQAEPAAAIFSREAVAARLPVLLPLLGLWLAALVAALAVRPAKKSRPAAPASVPAPALRLTRGAVLLRAALLAFALVLIVLGVLNGGLRDVFVKAANICTECIGLG